MRDDDMTEFHDLGQFVTPRQVAAGIREGKTYKLAAPVAGDAVALAALKSEPGQQANESASAYAYRVARAALAQDRASQAGNGGVPDGWVLVPMEPPQHALDYLKVPAVGNWHGMLALMPVAPTPAADRENGHG